jgi:hypothetical protein
MPYQTKQELFKFPMRGVHVVGMKNEQPEGTCIDAQNVRPFDPIEQRARGGNRPGLSRYYGTEINGVNRIQDLNYVTTIATALNVGSLSRRTIIPTAVSDGAIYKFTTASATAATVTGTQALGNATQSPFAHSAELFQRLYFCDGFGYKMYVGANNVAQDWTPTAGSLPGDQGNNIVCRLIEAWRGRLVLSGLASDPHNWFMTKLGDPLDLSYFPSPPTELDAVTGGNGNIGKVPDIINAIIPYSDDVLIFGCDHSIWMMSGDPQAGGRLDLVTNTVGMSFGRPYTQAPDGTLYFFSSRGSVYRMPPGGGKPQNITENSIDPQITNTNLNTHIVRLAYDEGAEGVHVYITPLTNGAATHWFHDIRNEGWFKVVFGSNGHNPVSTVIFDGDDPDDRVLLLGSETGFVNIYNTSAWDDAGDDFIAYAIMGPIVAESGSKPTVLTDLQFVMDDTAANTIYEIGEGDTAEAAIGNFTAGFTGDRHAGDNTAIVIQSGKSVNINPRTRGYFQYFKVGSTTLTGPWAIEYIQAKYRIVSSSRGRAFLTESIIYNAPGQPPFVNSSGLIAGFYISKNVTLNTNTALMDSWAHWQDGDATNTTPPLNFQTLPVPYTASDSTMNSRPTITLDGSAQNLENDATFKGFDNTQGWVIFSGYYDRNPSDQGSLIDILPFGGGADWTANLDEYNTVGYGFQIMQGASTQPAFVPSPGYVNTNTATVFSIGRRNDVGWIIRANGTEKGTWLLGAWWDDIDTGAGVGVRLGVGARFTMGSLHFYRGSKSNAQVRAIEEEIATYYGITLD